MVILKQKRLEKKFTAFMVACKLFAMEILWRQCFCKQTNFHREHTQYTWGSKVKYWNFIWPHILIITISNLCDLWISLQYCLIFLLPATIHYENTMNISPSPAYKWILKHWCRYWVVFVCVVVIWVYIVVMCLQKWHYR